MTRLWLLLALTACGQPQVVGYACPEQGCPEPAVQPFDECGLTLAPPPVKVAGDAKQCWVYSLDQLGGQPEDPIYLTGVTPSVSVPSHHVDVRLISAEALDPVEYPDGPLAENCADLWDQPHVAPLLATSVSASGWDLSDAPLVTTPSHRVLIELHYVGMSDRIARIALRLTCQREQPAVVTQAFAFSREEDEQIWARPGEAVTLCTSCNFTTDVQLHRLFRRTHLIEDFRVSAGGRPLWTTGADSPCRSDPLEPWRCDFPAPYPVSALDVVEWECLYLNTGDSSVSVGRGADDECSLFGVYSQPTGVHGPPQSCRRTEAASESVCTPIDDL